MVNVGFTGTRYGMSDRQKQQLRMLLRTFSRQIDEFHHGCARGADTEAVAILNGIRTTWPADAGHVVEVPHPPKSQTPPDLLARNRAIVLAVQILIAAPQDDDERIRSGTWYTVRQARRWAMPVITLSR